MKINISGFEANRRFFVKLRKTESSTIIQDYTDYKAIQRAECSCFLYRSLVYRPTREAKVEADLETNTAVSSGQIIQQDTLNLFRECLIKILCKIFYPNPAKVHYYHYYFLKALTYSRNLIPHLQSVPSVQKHNT